MVCASFFRRVLEECSPGKFVAEFGKDLCIYVFSVLAMKWSLLLFILSPTVIEHPYLAGVWLWLQAGLHWICFLILRQTCLNFARGSMLGFGGTSPFSSFPGPGKCSCTSYTPDVPGYWIKPCGLIWKSEQAVPFCCFKNSISQGGKQDWGSLNV